MNSYGSSQAVHNTPTRGAQLSIVFAVIAIGVLAVIGLIAFARNPVSTSPVVLSVGNEYLVLPPHPLWLLKLHVRFLTDLPHSKSVIFPPTFPTCAHVERRVGILFRDQNCVSSSFLF